MRIWSCGKNKRLASVHKEANTIAISSFVIVMFLSVYILLCMGPVVDISVNLLSCLLWAQ